MGGETFEQLCESECNSIPESLFALKKQGIGSLAFKIALDQALMVNEVMAQEWLSLHLHIHDSDAD
jgi:hypothetical protein